jgi:DNA-binding response OmpR family regulator
MPRITDPSDTPSSANPLPTNGKTILMAEDDPFIARMYETKLRNAGYAVVVKNNGRDAYEEIKRSRPDLMIIDINMPELSGLELLSALSGEGYDFSTSPAMVLTNSGEPEDRAAAEKLGADYMVKAELTPQAVLEKINAKINSGTPPEA